VAGAALLFAALGDPTRLTLLEQLSRGDAQRHLDVIVRGWDSALARLQAHVEG
jgi:hypothetical protein